MHAWIIHQLNTRPQLGVFASAGGALSGLLTLLGYLTPLVGFTAAVLGAVAGFYTARIKRAEWLRLKEEEKSRS